MQLILIDMHTIKVPLNVLFLQARVTPPCIRPWLSLWSSVTLWRRGILHPFTIWNNKQSTVKRLANHNFWHPLSHDDVIKWKHFPRYWPFVRGIPRSPVNSRTKPVTRSFNVYFDLRPNKRLSKQPWGWWFETPSWSLWRQCNDLQYTATNGHDGQFRFIMSSDMAWSIRGTFQYKDYRSRYAYCQHKEKTVMRSSYRYNVNLYSGEKTY